TFVAWRSRLGLWSRMTALAMLLLLSFPVGQYLNQHVFGSATHHSAPTRPERARGMEKYWGMKLLVVPDRNPERAAALRHFLPYQRQGTSFEIALHRYHVIAFCLLVAFFLALEQRFRGLFYYSALYRRIGDVLRSLSSA